MKCRMKNVECRNKNKITWYLILGTLLIIFSSCITLSEESFFFPEKHEALKDEDMGTFKRINITLKTENNLTLHGLYLKHKKSKDYLIYFYGNGESVFESQHRLYYLAKYYSFNIICFDYRGYGFSEGKPSFDALLYDSPVIYDYVNKTYKPKSFLFSASQ